MKNARETELRTCICKELRDFEYIIYELFGDTVTVSASLEGISIYDEESDDEEALSFENVCAKLAEYFGVSFVTSYHIDDFDYPLVWIVYKE